MAPPQLDYSTYDPDDVIEYSPEVPAHPAATPTVSYDTPASQNLKTAEDKKAGYYQSVKDWVASVAREAVDASIGPGISLSDKNKNKIYNAIYTDLYPKVMEQLESGRSIREIKLPNMGTKARQAFYTQFEKIEQGIVETDEDIKLLETNPGAEPTVKPSMVDFLRDVVEGPPIIAPEMDEVEEFVYEHDFEGAGRPEVSHAEAATMDPASMNAASMEAVGADQALLDPWAEIEAQGRERQIEALNLTRDAALGLAPSQAEIQMQMGLDQAIQNQIAAANAARGGAGAAMRAQRIAAQQGSQMQQAGIREQAALRAGEMAQARQAFMGGATQVRSADQFMYDLAQVRALAEAGFVNEARALNAKLEQEANANNAQWAQDAAQQNGAWLQQTEFFNAGADNAANIMENQNTQQAGLQGNEYRFKEGLANLETRQTKAIQDLNSKLTTMGMDLDMRMNMISGILGVARDQIQSALQVEGMEFEGSENQKDRDLREWEVNKMTESDPWQDFLDVFSPVASAVGGGLSFASTFNRPSSTSSGPTFSVNYQPRTPPGYGGYGGGGSYGQPTNYGGGGSGGWGSDPWTGDTDDYLNDIGV